MDTSVFISGGEQMDFKTSNRFGATFLFCECTRAVVEFAFCYNDRERVGLIAASRQQVTN